MTTPGARRRQRAGLPWSVAAVQLLPVPLVLLGHLGWTAVLGLYSVEAAVIGLAHLASRRRGRLRGPGPDEGRRSLVAALLLTLPTTVLGVAALGDVAPAGWQEPVAVLVGLGLLLGGLVATGLRSGRLAAIGTRADATVRLGLVWVAWLVTGVGSALTDLAPRVVASVCLVLAAACFELVVAHGHGAPED